jgi:hypothetical protein
MPKPKTVNVIPFAEIERAFDLAPLRLGLSVYPAVSKREGGGYAIRVHTGTRGSTDSYDYFYTYPDGTISAAPRGYAKDYRLGRIAVDELDAAVARYAQAVA